MDWTNLRGYDPSGMLDVVLAFSKSFNSCVKPPGFSPPPFSSLVFSGMGASAIAGEVLSNILEAYGSPVQVCVNRSPHIPAWADSRTLVLACSYSGNTRETLSAAQEALSRGLDMVAMVSGGKLKQWSEERKIPVISLPSGMQPRAAFPQCMAALVSFLLSAHDTPLLSQWTEETCEDLEKLAPMLKTETSNPALDLARDIGESNPIFYGEGVLRGAARRAACQFNENSKLLSFSGTIPEMGHNEIMGWSNKKGSTVPVLLGDGIEVDLAAEVMGESCIRVPISARNPMSRALSAIFLADTASVYSALERGVDPTPVEAIMRLKALHQKNSQ